MLLQITAIREWGFENTENRVVEYIYKEPRVILINTNQIVYIQPIGENIIQIKLVEHTSFHIEYEYEEFVKLMDEHKKITDMPYENNPE